MAASAPGPRRMLTLAGGATVHTVSLDQAHQDDLGGQGGDDALCVDQGGVAQVVQTVTVEDLCAGLEPGGLTKLDTAVLLQQLWGHAAQGSQHGLQSTYLVMLPFLKCRCHVFLVVSRRPMYALGTFLLILAHYNQSKHSPPAFQ